MNLPLSSTLFGLALLAAPTFAFADTFADVAALLKPGVYTGHNDQNIKCKVTVEHVEIGSRAERLHITLQRPKVHSHVIQTPVNFEFANNDGLMLERGRPLSDYIVTYQTDAGTLNGLSLTRVKSVEINLKDGNLESLHFDENILDGENDPDELIFESCQDLQVSVR